MISVIVPIFNVESYLDECLKSIVNQTFKDIEVLCIDDCTLDNSISIVKKYMRLDPRVRLINHAENCGLGGARNTGIREAKGEYISFIDSDDVMEPTMLEKLYAAITRDNVDAAICGIYRFVEGKERYNYTTFHYLDNPAARTYVIKGNKERLIDLWPSAPNKLYKTSVIREHACAFPERLLYEDHFFYYNYFKHVDAFSYVNEYLYGYRAERPGSITSTLSGREKEVFTVLKSLKTVFQDAFSADTWERSYAKICFRLIWERNFLFWPNPKEWRKFSDMAFQWLLDEFDMHTLHSAVDASISPTDAFYRYIFSTGIHKFSFKMRIILKDTKCANILRKIYYRIKGFRTTRSFIKELIWKAYDTGSKLDELTSLVKSLPSMQDNAEYENSDL